MVCSCVSVVFAHRESAQAQSAVARKLSPRGRGGGEVVVVGMSVSAVTSADREKVEIENFKPSIPIPGNGASL